METRFLQTLMNNSPFTEHLPYLYDLVSSPCGLRTGPDNFALRRRQNPRSSNEVG